MRQFKRLARALHERLEFHVATVCHSASALLGEDRFFGGPGTPFVFQFDTNQECDAAHGPAAAPDTWRDVLPAGSLDGWDLYLMASGVSAMFTRRRDYDWWDLQPPFDPVSFSSGHPELKRPWFQGQDTLLRVSFGQSLSFVTIPEAAFYGSALKEIHIPDSVQSLCRQCFQKCVRLSRVTFGPSSSLKDIGDAAFYRSGLKEIHIPDSVESLGEKCFWKCRHLSSVTFGERSSLKSIGSDCFCFCPISRFVVPSELDYIGGPLFTGCPLVDFVVCDANTHFTLRGPVFLEQMVCVRGLIGNVGEIVIPDNVEILCERCFADCRNLTLVVFGEESSLRAIGREAFANSALHQIHIPDKVECIGTRCFYGCQRLMNVTFGERSSLKVIGPEAFSLSGLVDIEVPDTVEELGDKSFSLARHLFKVALKESSALKKIGTEAFFGSGISAIHIPPNVEALPDKCFAACPGLNFLTFSDDATLKRIGSGAFCGTGLVGLRIPDSVEEVDDRCFSACGDLRNVSIAQAASLKRVGSCCFVGSDLKSVSLPNNVVSVGGSSFSECPLTNFAIHDDNDSFTVVRGLLLSKDKHVCYSTVGKPDSVVVPRSVQEISAGCFRECAGLAHVIFGKRPGVRVFGPCAFLYSGLKRVLIPRRVEELPEKCFADCQMLAQVRFARRPLVKRFGPEAFAGCFTLKEMRIPSGVEELGESCFAWCSALELVTFGAHPKLRSIGDCCFCGCRIDRMWLPVTVVAVGGSAFSENPWIRIAMYEDSLFDIIDNCFLSRDRRVFYSCVGQRDSITIPDCVEELAPKCFCMCDTLASVRFGPASSLQVVGEDAFRNCGVGKVYAPKRLEERLSHVIPTDTIRFVRLQEWWAGI